MKNELIRGGDVTLAFCGLPHGIRRPPIGVPRPMPVPGNPNIRKPPNGRVR